MTDGIERDEIKDWRWFFDKVESLPGLWLFRGHSDAEWSLEPKLARVVKGLDEETARLVEDKIRREFNTQAHLYVPSRMVFPENDVPSQLGVMQHYGAPTRLLDWSLSPYVAAYFATEGHNDVDGVIWILNGRLVQEEADKQYKRLASVLYRK